MKALILQAASQLNCSLDTDRFLVVDAARWKRSVFLYRTGSREPDFVLRMPGHRSTAERCEAEHEALKAFETLSLKGLRAPRALGQFTSGDFECYIQECIPSKSWLQQLPRTGRLPKQTHIDTAVDLLVKLYNASATQKSDDIASTRCFQHRDFSIGNIGWLEKTAILYDFEYARPQGYPLYDLLHFLLYYRIALRNRGLMRQNVAKGEYDATQEQRHFHLTAEDIQATIIDPGSFQTCVAKSVIRYCHACGIGSEEAERLIVHTVEQAVENGRGVSGVPTDWQRNLMQHIEQKLDHTP